MCQQPTPRCCLQYCAFVYGSQYVSNEGDLILPHSTLQYFLLALAGVFVVTTFMLVREGGSLAWRLLAKSICQTPGPLIWWPNGWRSQASAADMADSTLVPACLPKALCLTLQPWL
jgi:hypothetical protein